ncbi:MAG: hypothetical protein Q7T33_09435 [Dehalococcoidia bacterium]|nr:hypothetical protein [Dehalococcoidia bacterium]
MYSQPLPLRATPFVLAAAVLVVAALALLASLGDARAGVLLSGDVDCSGGVSIADAQKLSRSLVGLAVTQTPPCPGIGDGVPGFGFDWGDVDCSGSVSIGDAQKIARDLIALPVSISPPCPQIGDTLGESGSPTPGPTGSPPPTSEALIAAALEADDITYEESLLYRAYALYADARLPTEFSSPVVDWEAGSDLFFEVDQNEAQLSPELLAGLAPFRARPNDPISIFNTLPEGAGLAALGPALAWRSLLVANTNARVWLKATSDAELERYVNAVSQAWSALGASPGKAAIFRYPNPDQAEIPNLEINPDSAIDFYFLDRSAVDPRWDGCVIIPDEPECTLATAAASGMAQRAAEFVDNKSSSYLMIDKDIYQESLISVTAHELTHAAQFAYDTGETSWLMESTATWAEHQVMKRLGKIPSYPYSYLADFFKGLGQTLTRETESDKNAYGSWLFFFFASMKEGDGIVTSVWQHAATPGADGITAVDDAFNLDEHFDDFTVSNWNRDPVREPDQYKTADDTFKSGLEPPTDKVENATPNVYLLDSPVPGLASKYYSFKFDPSVRKVTFENLLHGVQYAHVWAIKQIDFSWKEPEDWTGAERKKFCRDIEEEDLTQLVIIVSNSHPTDSLPFDPDPRVKAQAPGCSGWRGTAHSTLTEPATGGVRVVMNDAILLWEYHDPEEDNGHYYYHCEVEPEPCLLYIPKGDIDWTYSYTRMGGSPCSEEYSGTIPAGNVIARYDQELLLRPDGDGGYFYSGNGLDPTFFIEIVCEATGGYAPVHYFAAPESEQFRVGEDGRTISGSYSYLGSEGRGTFEFEWDLHRLGPGPPN